MNVEIFHDNLIVWGKTHFRSFPWRSTDDPYKLLVAEVMLHRTQASQVAPVYTRFLESYPDVRSLAEARLEDLHSTLYSLGLRWRIDLIYELGQVLLNSYNGEVPEEKSELLKLPGVSDYIASAVRCFAWNLPEPLIDTNTVRVVGRLYNLEIKDSSRRNRRFRQLITDLVDPANPRSYNYALLDLADHVCTKKRPPDCLHCPLVAWCLFGKQRLAELLTKQLLAK